MEELYWRNKYAGVPSIAYFESPVIGDNVLGKIVEET